jgi:hypothetical protein
VTSEQQLRTYPLEELFARSNRILKGLRFIVILSSTLYRSNDEITVYRSFKNMGIFSPSLCLAQNLHPFLNNDMSIYNFHGYTNPLTCIDIQLTPPIQYLTLFLLTKSRRMGVTVCHTAWKIRKRIFISQTIKQIF